MRKELVYKIIYIKFEWMNLLTLLRSPSTTKIIKKPSTSCNASFSRTPTRQRRTTYQLMLLRAIQKTQPMAMCKLSKSCKRPSKLILNARSPSSIWPPLATKCRTINRPSITIDNLLTRNKSMTIERTLISLCAMRSKEKMCTRSRTISIPCASMRTSAVQSSITLICSCSWANKRKQNTPSRTT